MIEIANMTLEIRYDLSQNRNGFISIFFSSGIFRATLKK